MAASPVIQRPKILIVVLKTRSYCPRFLSHFMSGSKLLKFTISRVKSQYVRGKTREVELTVSSQSFRWGPGGTSVSQSSHQSVSQSATSVCLLPHLQRKGKTRRPDTRETARLDLIFSGVGHRRPKPFTTFKKIPRFGQSEVRRQPYKNDLF